jgi:putative ABC transport system ATP-binding protein
MIEIKNITKTYGTGEAAFTALKGISLSVGKGDFAAITGESGSGKSTLLSITGGMNTPCSGSVNINGQDIYLLNQEERSVFRNMELGFVFQSFYLVPYLTIEENVMVPLAPLDIKSRVKKEMAQEAMEKVGIYPKRKNLPGEVSGGEMERAAVARAVVNNPSLLLADEPTGNLDSATGRKVMDLFSSLNKTGMTIVMVTHSSDCAAAAERVIKMSDGMII